MYLFDIKIIPTLYGRLIVASMFLCFPHRNAKETPDRLLRPESLPDLVGSVDGESRTAFLAWQRRGFKTELKEPEGMTWPWEQRNIGACGGVWWDVLWVKLVVSVDLLYVYIYYIITFNLRKVCWKKFFPPQICSEAMSVRFSVFGWVDLVVFWPLNHNPYHPCMVYFTYIWLIFMVNVGKYTIHGLFG